MGLVARGFPLSVRSSSRLGGAAPNIYVFRVFPSSWRPETRETDVTARPTDFSVYQVGSSGHFCTRLGAQVAPVALAGA